MSKATINQYSVRRGTGFLLLSLVATIIIVVLFTPTRPVIELSFLNQSCYLDNTRFDLKWRHSVEKQWWIESYRIEDDHLLLADAYLQTFGAGTPSTEAVAVNQRPELSGFVRYRIDTTLPYLDWMVSRNIQAQVITRGSRGLSLPVFQWVDDYTNIHIAPNRLSFWRLFTKESCHDYYPH